MQVFVDLYVHDKLLMLSGAKHCPKCLMGMKPFTAYINILSLVLL